MTWLWGLCIHPSQDFPIDVMRRRSKEKRKQKKKKLAKWKVECLCLCEREEVWLLVCIRAHISMCNMYEWRCVCVCMCLQMYPRTCRMNVNLDATSAAAATCITHIHENALIWVLMNLGVSEKALFSRSLFWLLPSCWNVCEWVFFYDVLFPLLTWFERGREWVRERKKERLPFCVIACSEKYLRLAPCTI